MWCHFQLSAPGLKLGFLWKWRIGIATLAVADASLRSLSLNLFHTNHSFSRSVVTSKLSNHVINCKSHARKIHGNMELKDKSILVLKNEIYVQLFHTTHLWWTFWKRLLWWISPNIGTQTNRPISLLIVFMKHFLCRSCWLALHTVVRPLPVGTLPSFDFSSFLLLPRLLRLRLCGSSSFLNLLVLSAKIPSLFTHALSVFLIFLGWVAPRFLLPGICSSSSDLHIRCLFSISDGLSKRCLKLSALDAACVSFAQLLLQPWEF